jgi:hypothetical protein
MAEQDGRKLPVDLTRGRDRFRVWRRTRKPGTRIPEQLWQLAATLATAHGVSRTSMVLGLDYYALKKRVESATSTSNSTASPFVELSLPPSIAARECVIELEDIKGARMRVQLKGYDTPDVVALSRSFWNGE